VDDFGSQGDAPSHADLLDWLAVEFQRTWSVKAIQRLIVTSATYRQSSAVRMELIDRDPDNSLLARQTRQRVEGEVLRDLALATSGLLDPRIGGPSVRPLQPAGYSNLTYANSAKWKVSEGGDAYRRGLYTFFQRTSPYPMLMTFDGPDSNTCCPERNVSNTPLQALSLWNDKVFFECAQALARQVVSDERCHDDCRLATRRRAADVFQRCLARRPTRDELQDIVQLYEASIEMVSADASRIDGLIGTQPLSKHVDLSELAAWVLVSRTLLNLDEFVTRD
jgi:hypothetical protein